ncbi:hypothetical protein AP064_05070 [Candidatus Liberibacter solanacearum]|uniref:hypothetical protein n=1 Tax=Candidatus Liberibacter solanacearum TaxID=556287 RepID=UPI0006DD3470|nr:hypothetical protein [Candidatus Liberibacter solanacearum]KQC48732.1 hypothetical protein AP064_05070 [Candidatus Liberibacter solanacearum]
MTDVKETPVSTPIETKGEHPETPPLPKEEAVQQSTSQSSNPFSSSSSTEEAEASQLNSEDYTLNCPEYIPQEEVKAHSEAFKEAGIDAKTAQKVIDRLVAHGQENEKRSIERLDKALAEDKTALKSEYGVDYSRREKDIARYFRQEKIADADVQALVSTWGFQKTFKFFDRYAQMNKETSVGDTFARSEGSRGSQEDYDKLFNNPEFIEKRKAGDTSANNKIKQWANQQALLDQ